MSISAFNVVNPTSSNSKCLCAVALELPLHYPKFHITMVFLAGTVIKANATISYTLYFTDIYGNAAVVTKDYDPARMPFYTSQNQSMTLLQVAHRVILLVFLFGFVRH